MALLVEGSYTTPQGFELTSTYWRWVNLGIEVTQGSGNVILYGYKDEEAFNEGKQNIGGKTFAIAGVEFGTLVLSAPTGPTLSDAISNKIYELVIARANDEAVPDRDTFFANATQV